MESPLTDLGKKQSYALGRLLGTSYPPSLVIEHVVLSPFVRTRQTTDSLLKGLGYAPPCIVEERIREIEFGAFDGLSKEQIQEKYPDEALRRERDGKYWYRPPGGESRPDVRLRVHSFLDTLNRDYVGKRVLIVCHSVVVLAFRSLIERWGENDYMQVDSEDDVKNCGLTRYMRVNNKLVMVQYNSVAPVLEGVV